MVCLRNPLQPVNRLPPEIIVLCAAFVPRTEPKPIVSLTHVCRYWREAIASSPSNWTLIGSKWKQLATLFLERAGVAPLTVTISAWDLKEDSGDFLQILLPHVARISQLSLRVSTSIEKVTHKHPGFFASMPDLTSLELHHNVRPSEWFPSNEAPVPSIFRNVSKLTSLRLTRVPLYPTLFNITSLVELKFVGLEIPFQNFIGFLESNFSLEIVVLDLSFTRGSVLTAPEKKTSLPRLRRLALTCGRAISVRGLLSCLSLPRGINIEVQEREGHSYGDLASVLPYPPTPIQDLLAPITTIKSLHLRGWLHLSGNDGSFSFHSDAIEEKPYQEFDLFATGAVRQVHIHLSTMSGPWLFERLPALEVLVLSGRNPEPKPLTVLAKDPTLCPSLKTIALVGCIETFGVLRELESMLRERENSAAARLHRIVIVNKTWDMPNEIGSVSRFRKLVTHVDIMVGDDLPDLL